MEYFNSPNNSYLRGTNLPYSISDKNDVVICLKKPEAEKLVKAIERSTTVEGYIAEHPVTFFLIALIFWMAAELWTDYGTALYESYFGKRVSPKNFFIAAAVVTAILIGLMMTLRAPESVIGVAA